MPGLKLFFVACRCWLGCLRDNAGGSTSPLPRRFIIRVLTQEFYFFYPVEGIVCSCWQTSISLHVFMDEGRIVKVACFFFLRSCTQRKNDKTTIGFLTTRILSSTRRRWYFGWSCKFIFWINPCPEEIESFESVWEVREGIWQCLEFSREYGNWKAIFLFVPTYVSSFVFAWFLLRNRLKKKLRTCRSRAFNHGLPIIGVSFSKRFVHGENSSPSRISIVLFNRTSASENRR